jgi:iron complex outermembrane receptor protein
MNKWVPAAVAAGFAFTTNFAAAADEPGMEEVVVIGSRIPRLKAEGPAPVTTISAEDIEANGLTTVPDVLFALTQNTGATQSQQDFAGADFTPGAEAVDLRGLGPNHTLVLVNGRRIADFPLPLNGLSNFTDISSIPLSMVERIDTLSGSASAVYGSDAIAGVVNIVLKKNVDSTDVSYRYGMTEAGGGQSQRFTLSSGWSSDKFNAVFGFEYLDQKPLWAFDRDIQDSTADNPTDDVPLARRDFLRMDPVDEVYLDPGQATCAGLADLNKGTIYWATRAGWGPYDDDIEDWGDGHFCGSNESIGWGTVLSRRQGVTAFGSLTYEASGSLIFFTDVMIGSSKVELFPDTLAWSYQDENGSEDGVFFNESEGVLDFWQRIISPEEMGGLERGMTRTKQETLTVTPGIRGAFSENWAYEAYFNHTQYELKVSWPQIVASAANELFLGEQTGIDDDSGYASFDAPVSRLYTPLTQAEYDSIATFTTYHPEAKNDYLSFTLTNGRLFHMPAGDVGFAANLEAGKQSYELNPDPLALEYYYYGWRDQDGHGSRKHWSAAAEMRMPLLETLELSAAGRFDDYDFADSGTSKFTYNVGLEFRPIPSLLFRGYYGTGFRAPDLHYLFAGEGNVHPSANDYYLCRTEEPDEELDDCSYADVGIVSTRTGNPNLDSETSTTLGAGIVWAPNDHLFVSLDYWDIQLENEVVNLSIDGLLRDEADCRIGQTVNGTAVDVNSPTCQDAIARVTRYADTDPIAPGELFGVRVNPINVATENTSGFDFGFRYTVPLGGVEATVDGGYTRVFDHEIQQYPGDPVTDQFRLDSGYVVPRSKASLSVTLKKGDFSGTLHARRLDKLTNWDEEARIPASIRVNGSLEYSITDAASLSLVVKNLLDKGPEKDPTYRSYPYYDMSWFDSVGRSYFLTATYGFAK